MAGLNHRRRDLNMDLNLTSFIDLLSTIVCFLLISAVWIQVASLDIKQTHGTDAAASKKDSFEISMDYTRPDRMTVILKKNNRRIGRKRIKAKDHDEMMDKAKAIVASWVNGKKKRKIDSAFVKPIRGIEYGQMIQALDVLRSNNIKNIGVMNK